MALVKPNAIAGGLSGTTGNAVFAETEYGTVMRNRPTPSDTSTPAQEAIRSNMERVSRAYGLMTPDQYAGWQKYIASLPLPKGKQNRPKVYHTYSGLACKYLQMVPGGAPPLDAPSGPFFGDVVRIAVTAQSKTLVFTADAPNAPDVVTELVMQPLRHAVQAVVPDRYRSQGFHHFALGILEFRLEVKPGWYACAYRFVHANTGQDTRLAPLPPVQVPS